MGRSTIADVARAAGVSTATVSRVLTGSVPVSEALQQKVLAAAEELDYTVNVMARALRRDRTSSIGMVVPDLANPFFTLLVDGVERRIQQLGMSLHLCSSHNDPEVEADRIGSLQASRAAVLLVTPVHVTTSGETLRAASENVPVIQLDQYADDVDSDWVGIDERHGMQVVLEHLAAMGAESAAYIGGALTDSSARSRYAAALDRAHAVGVTVEPDDRLLGRFSVEWGREAAHLLAASGPLPDAIVCGADVVALGVLEAFDTLGIRVPDDVLVTGFDDIAISAHPRLSLTTVRQPLDLIAQRAVDILVDIVDDPDGHELQRVALEPELVVRSSSRLPELV